MRLPVGEDPNGALVLERFAPEQTYKTKVYAALKQAIVNMDIYSGSEPTWLDERQLSEKLGVSRTPVREAVAMLEQEGFVKSMPRRGIMVLKKTRREVIEMVEAWAALESMAARLACERASDDAIGRLRHLFENFDEAHPPADFLNEYSAANVEFHQALVQLSGSGTLIEITSNIFMHVRGIRQITIGRDDRATRSMSDHLAIIEAVERRDVDAAERLSREHTLGLARYVEEHGDIFD
ncbi:GntR family transcriptional regulator [Hansschlegelia zhihuaiae]|uniref:GntR family transcriptional regulator n=1 Tax=Hansschlegelia zhihuaiae TaxID=405005 RepID=A0A4Q0M4D9_9HYPH|nr:GntR family transcriptional regulator [Hansschlegelia zhihuaiae]RXF67811.1 GntR family transcriptional regulator [Hansschlegelia zhihuaiae]